MRSRSGRLHPLALLAMGLFVPAADAAAQHVVGREVRFATASPHPYAGVGAAWSVRIRHPGATYIAVHFDRLDLAPGDRVLVRTPDSRQVHTFTGRGKGNLGTFWATHVTGDAAVVELRTDAASPGGWGIAIDRFAAGTAGLDPISPEAICGSDDKRNAVCYADGEPVMYERSRAVARLLINGVSQCTGFLVGCRGHLLTNRHCINSAFDALNTDYEFLAEAPSCFLPNCDGCFPGTFWTGTPTLIRADSALDYALVLLDGDPQEVHGTLVPDDRAAIPGERIYIPQHPGGRAREIAVGSSDPGDPSGFCEVFSANEPPCQVGETVPNIGYFCDTEGGSSGSPVLATSNHRVVGLHHCAECPNRAIPITAVLEDLGDLLPSCIPEEVSPAGAAVPFRMQVDAGGTVEFERVPAPDVAYHLYQADTLGEMLAGDWSHKYCDLEINPFGIWSAAGDTLRWTPASPLLLLGGYWVVVAANRLVGAEGSYGVQSNGAPRPPDADGSPSGFGLGCPAPGETGAAAGR